MIGPYDDLDSNRERLSQDQQIEPSTSFKYSPLGYDLHSDKCQDKSEHIKPYSIIKWQILSDPFMRGTALQRIGQQDGSAIASPKFCGSLA